MRDRNASPASPALASARKGTTTGAIASRLVAANGATAATRNTGPSHGYREWAVAMKQATTRHAATMTRTATGAGRRR
ncbi:MAG: hypothetical protein L0H79_19140 [Intrasporangium sp.]|uniref:hypothetical protein n=1 Tax=Intrasporangium sp. TaxID=1925024 RepID=UPI00264821C1|nr:hypothetical protein [Intrasporangium sp.]MDN5797842.1 hypothetical protein [Intrasporangium sp.]